MRLQRRLPSTSWLVPRDLCGTGRAEIPVGPSSSPSAPRPPIPPSEPAVPPLCADVQGRRRLRAKDQLPNPARGADPEHRLNMTEPAAGWSVSRNRHTNDAQLPQARLLSPTYIWPRQSPRRRRRRPRRWKRRKAWLPSCRKRLWPAGHMSPVVRCRRYQPSDHGPQTDKSGPSVNLHSATRPPRYPLVSS
jgi:hypothetical protein